MTIKKRTVEGLISANPVSLTPLGLGASFGVLKAIRAQSYASSAKAATSTDTAFKLKITDANSDIVYLDAADADFGTAQRTVWPSGDDTITGITAATGGVGVDQTGAAVSAGQGSDIVMQSPVTVAVVGGATATDYIVVELLVDV